MFVKLTKSGPRSYVQLVEAYRDESGRPVQRTVATLGRLDQMGDSMRSMHDGLSRLLGLDVGQTTCNGTASFESSRALFSATRVSIRCGYMTFFMQALVIVKLDFVRNVMLNSVVIKLSGGIGNQLFQTVFGLSLAEKFSAVSYVNTDSFDNYSYHHEPEILKLRLDTRILSDDKHMHRSDSAFILRDTQIKSLADVVALPTHCHTLFLEGYWQDENFLSPQIIDLVYSKVREKFEKDSKPRDRELEQRASKTIAVHFRRRDYAHMGYASNEYYAASVKCLTEFTGINSLSLYSDEPNFAMHLLRSLGYQDVNIVRSGDDWTDLYMLSCHRYIIMANSTYSWWGARFGELASAKLVLRPSPWLTIDNKLDPCPQRWIVVPTSVVSGLSLDSDRTTKIHQELQRAMFDDVANSVL